MSLSLSAHTHSERERERERDREREREIFSPILLRVCKSEHKEDIMLGTEHVFTHLPVPHIPLQGSFKREQGEAYGGSIL